MYAKIIQNTSRLNRLNFSSFAGSFFFFVGYPKYSFFELKNK